MTSSPELQALTTAQFLEAQRNGALVLDVRTPEQFVSFHIRGAIQIGLVGPFASWAAMLIAPPQKLVLVAENFRGACEAHTRLTRVGFERVIGYLLADEIGWRSEGIDLASIATHRSANISETSQRGFSMQLVDVRSQAEWKRGHLPGAVFVPLLNLASETNQIDRSRTTLVYCREGYRATTAASILLRRCSDNVAILADGVEGWSALGLPLAMASDPSIDPFSAPLNKCSFDRV